MSSAQPSRRVQVRHDPRVFTISVLLNLAGYDHENAPAFHPVRARLRQELAPAVPTGLVADFRGFWQEHGWHHIFFITHALLTDEPPLFTPMTAADITPQTMPLGGDFARGHFIRLLTEMAGHSFLQRAWEVPALQAAFHSIEDESLTHARLMADALERGVERAVTYLGADPDYLELPYVLVSDLLLSYWEACQNPIGDSFIEVRGPVFAKPGDPVPFSMEDPHEFVHIPLIPVTRDPARVAAYQPRIDDLFRRAMTYPMMKANYGSPRDWLDECLVKAVCCRLVYNTGSLQPRSVAVQEASLGYLLEPWFYEKLADYEPGKITFAEWFDRIMADFDAAAVLRQLASLGICPPEPA